MLKHVKTAWNCRQLFKAIHFRGHFKGLGSFWLEAMTWNLVEKSLQGQTYHSLFDHVFWFTISIYFNLFHYRKVPPQVFAQALSSGDVGWKIYASPIRLLTTAVAGRNSPLPALPWPESLPCHRSIGIQMTSDGGWFGGYSGMQNIAKLQMVSSLSVPKCSKSASGGSGWRTLELLCPNGCSEQTQDVSIAIQNTRPQLWQYWLFMNIHDYVLSSIVYCWHVGPARATAGSLGPWLQHGELHNCQHDSKEPSWMWCQWCIPFSSQLGLPSPLTSGPVQLLGELVSPWPVFQLVKAIGWEKSETV